MTKRLPLPRLVIGSALLSLMAACSVEQPWQRPEASIPATFKEAQAEDNAGWKLAEPAEEAPRGQWWAIFGDPLLDELEHQAIAANQDVQAAAARLRQARALAQAQEAARLPALDAGFGATRQRASPASQSLADGAQVPGQTLWRAQAAASYEVDLFGRVGSGIRAAQADAGRSVALFHSVLLALQADVAQHYFQLREFDAQLRVYQQTVALREDTLKLVERRFKEGEVGELDVARARNVLESARADAAGVARQRVVAEHSLAVLLGKPPAQFAFAAMPLAPVDVPVPAGLPSALLERRPDIAAAERAMAAAYARVGLARSAFFPRLDLTAMLGVESATLGNLFHWSSRTFLLGPLAGTALSVPLFDGGRRSAMLGGAQAQLDEDVALYRQQVLVAFREVEDSLADLRLLKVQSAAQTAAVTAAQRAGQLSQSQYEEGQVSYLEVIDAQRQILQARLQLNRLAGAQAAATVSLIRALGGGWDATAGLVAAR
ncbi:MULTISPECIES: efflux transporter outer membrane subunit [unclassified Janthinobacterium]|uniref:efflux transporter outer membrane subunit n=1 Tax=unclassified Janthinobacterium TaxID=2610881 RepID=UPI0017BC4DB7|nr:MULTISPECIES: efflux transporter outer membrane subunit [unclassified Janthinobacterium]MBB5384161.1 multidrug efflux system outer membrane protein [Janthinobacterium sp. K2Li3]